MSVPRVEKGYEKHAWILLFAIGIFFLLFASLLTLFGVGVTTFPDPQALKNLTGMTWDQIVAGSPGTANVIRLIERVAGILFAVSGVFIIVISRVSYRKGERWAWYLFWIVPASLVVVIANAAVVGGQFAVFFDLLTILSLLGLLLPYRKFFPRK